MDMLLPATDPNAATPGLAGEPARRASGFIQAGGRAVVLVDPSAPARAAALDSVLAALPAGAIKVGNPLASALTLDRLMFQLGIEDEGEDAGGLIVCALDVPSGIRMAVLAVDDGHSLTPEAITALARVPSPATPDQAGRLLLLAGGPGLLALVSGPGCEALRDPRLTLTVVAPAAAEAAAPLFAEAAAVPPFGEPGAADMPPPRPGTNRLWWVGLLLAGSFVAGLVGTPVLFWASQTPAPPPSASLADPEPPAAALPEPDAAEAAGGHPSSQAAPDLPKGRGTPQPTLAEADAQLRREFDAFLNRAGRDTAGLSVRSRKRLFREYLNWRSRDAGGPEARKPVAPAVP